MSIISEWLDEQVQSLIRCGLTHQEAARIHNARMQRHHVVDLFNRLFNEAGGGLADIWRRQGGHGPARWLTFAESEVIIDDQAPTCPRRRPDPAPTARHGWPGALGPGAEPSTRSSTPAAPSSCAWPARPLTGRRRWRPRSLLTGRSFAPRTASCATIPASSTSLRAAPSLSARFSGSGWTSSRCGPWAVRPAARPGGVDDDEADAALPGASFGRGCVGRLVHDRLRPGRAAHAVRARRRRPRPRGAGGVRGGGARGMGRASARPSWRHGGRPTYGRRPGLRSSSASRGLADDDEADAGPPGASFAADARDAAEGRAVVATRFGAHGRDRRRRPELLHRRAA